MSPARQAIRTQKPPPTVKDARGTPDKGNTPTGTRTATPPQRAGARRDARRRAHPHSPHTHEGRCGAPRCPGISAAAGRADASVSPAARRVCTHPGPQPASLRLGLPTPPALYVNQTRRASSPPLGRRAGHVASWCACAVAAPPPQLGGVGGEIALDPRAAVAVRLRQAAGAPASPCFSSGFLFFFSLSAPTAVSGPRLRSGLSAEGLRGGDGWASVLCKSRTSRLLGSSCRREQGPA